MENLKNFDKFIQEDYIVESEREYDLILDDIDNKINDLVKFKKDILSDISIIKKAYAPYVNEKSADVIVTNTGVDVNSFNVLYVTFNLPPTYEDTQKIIEAVKKCKTFKFFEAAIVVKKGRWINAQISNDKSEYESPEDKILSLSFNYSNVKL